MRLFERKEECCGCGACEAACAARAIVMKQDKEGFFYPQADETRCTGCGACLRVCPLKREEREEKKTLARGYYGARTLREDVRERSSSGGVFSVLADWVLEREGAVFAAGYGPDLRVAHREVDGKEQLDRVRRTKYVQSGMDGVYGAIRDRLAAGRQTLFAGTPCQAEAVRRFLERDGRADRDRLILVDLVCYGAASPGIWEKYVRFLGRRYGGKIRDFEFRDKRGKDNGHTVSWKNGSTQRAYSLYADPYCRLYFQDLILRPSCYECPFCRPERESDFTIGDFWGLERIRPDLDDGMGNSLVIVHSERAERIWREAAGRCLSFECRLEDLLQPRLAAPTPRPAAREWFMKWYRLLPFWFLLKKYGG